MAVQLAAIVGALGGTRAMAEVNRASGWTRRQVLAGAGAVSVVAASSSKSFADSTQSNLVRVSNQVEGPGLQTFGLNFAHYVAGSNTSAWVRYARIDSARNFTNPTGWITADDIHNGSGITDIEAFDAAKAELRADPEGSRFIAWEPILEAYENHIHVPTNFYTINYLFGEAKRLGLDMIVEMDVKNPWELSWEKLWQNWQRCYVHAYYLAKNFDVRRFSFFNEPDVPGYIEQIPSIEHYIRALRIGSDAIRCAVEDTGKEVGEPRSAIVHAPVITRSAMSSSMSGHPPDGPHAGEQNIELNKADDGYYADDPRDDEIGWGRSAMGNIRIDYHGDTVGYNVFDVYDTHSYLRSPDYYPGEVDVIRQKLAEYTPADTNLPIMYTELNRYNNWGYGQSSDSVDTPSIAREICAIGANCTTSEVDGVIFFKFAGALDANGEVQGVGFYYVDTEEPYDIRGPSRSAEALRFFAKAMVGDVARIGTEVEGIPEDFKAWSSYDEAAHRYHVLCLKHASPPVDFELDLSALDHAPPTGAQVTIEEVSSSYLGGIRDHIEMSESRRIFLRQPQWSLWLLTIPDRFAREIPAEPSSRTVASQNALVRSGADADTPLGATAGLAVRRADGRHEVTCLRFESHPLVAKDLVRATLQIYAGVSDGASTTTFSVFARPDWEWSESDLTWNTTPYLAAGDSRLDGAGNAWLPAGQLTVTGSLSRCAIDVTDIVAEFRRSSLTFMLIKQLRFPEDDAEDSREVSIASNAELPTDQRPRLRIWTSVR